MKSAHSVKTTINHASEMVAAAKTIVAPIMASVMVANNVGKTALTANNCLGKVKPRTVPRMPIMKLNDGGTRCDKLLATAKALLVNTATPTRSMTSNLWASYCGRKNDDDDDDDDDDATC